MERTSKDLIMKHSHSRLAFLLIYCGSGQKAGKTGTWAALGSVALASEGFVSRHV